MDYTSIWEQYEKLTGADEPTDEPNPNHIEFNRCVRCESLHSLCKDPTNGTLLCVECGLVAQSDCIDDTPEWSFGADGKEDPSRVGVPIDPLLEKSSLSTIITGKSKNSFMMRLHNQMSMNYVERARYHVFVNITKMASERGHLKPNVIDQAKYYYTVLSGRKLSRGAIRKGLIACCIMYACKNMNVPRSIKEISQITDVSIPVLNKTTKIFQEHMSDILVRTANDRDVADKVRYCDYQFEATNSSDLLLRYCNSLHIENQVVAKQLVREVRRVNEDMQRLKLVECKTPSAIVAGIVSYCIKKLDIPCIPKSRLSQLWDVSVVTINKIESIVAAHYSTSST
jgi:transcription initiation factor TFIIB